MLRAILCPVVLEDDSLSALSYAAELARLNGAKLYLLNVPRTPGPDMDVPVAIAPHPHWEVEAENSLSRIARQRLDGGVEYEVMVRPGIPETAIIEVAAEIRADLIVMATHGRTGLAHFILGSVTETIVREADCPVLTIRPKDGTNPPGGANRES